MIKKKKPYDIKRRLSAHGGGTFFFFLFSNQSGRGKKKKAHGGWTYQKLLTNKMQHGSIEISKLKVWGQFRKRKKEKRNRNNI